MDNIFIVEDFLPLDALSSSHLKLLNTSICKWKISFQKAFFPSLFCFFLSTLSLKVSCSFCCILCWSLLQKILFSTNKTQCEIITWYVERVHRCISTNGDWICNKSNSFRFVSRVRKMDGVDSSKKKEYVCTRVSVRVSMQQTANNLIEI